MTKISSTTQTLLLQTFFSRIAVRLLSKIVVICRNYNQSFMGGMINSKLNYTFHIILIYNRATFNNRVACCVDFIRESWQPLETSCKEFPQNKRS